MLTAWGHRLLYDDNSACNILFLHPLAVDFHLFNGYFLIFWKEHKHLISWIVGMARDNGQIFAAGLSFAWPIAKCLLEVGQGLVQFGLLSITKKSL